jgi:membrane-associated phospholipid phosphatase
MSPPCQIPHEPLHFNAFVDPNRHNSAVVDPPISMGAKRPSSVAQTLQLCWRNLAFQDVLLVVFHLFLWLRVSVFAPTSRAQQLASNQTFLLLTVTLTGILLCRGEVLSSSFARAIVYRVCILAPASLSYFALRFLLPALEPTLLDAQLLRVDEALFGQTPAGYWDAYVNPSTVEWFSFFYYSYFLFLVSYVVGSLVFQRGKLLYQMVLGAALVVSLGHSIYTLVPGFGPHVAMTFRNPLTGGFWWNTVNQAVCSAGAYLDIFPSLHTAYPTFFMLYTWHHRDRAPFKYVVGVTTFFTLNIIVATMFLRWHYAVDVVAGLLLAGLAFVVVTRLSEWEPLIRKRRAATQPIWEPLGLERARAHALTEPSR